MIERYRKEIDRIDSKILGLFEKRMVFSKKIGNYK
ncbi:chorismate mutase, partial [Candidatus Pacearchaeota archaeon]|nr:chorismate mutase [Candidatus Pacearchaeota archaeon]